MHRSARRVFNFILGIIANRTPLFFWTGVRLFSATLPLLTIYLYSLIIKKLEVRASLSELVFTLAFILFVRILDNYLRLLSISKLEYLISNLSFDIHNFFLKDISSDSRDDRHLAVQAIRNFSDASSTTLNLIKQPGIDSFVSLFFIPLILFFVDFPSFVITFAYIFTYFFIDYYTTQRYSELKDIQNSKTEAYFSKLQDSNDFDLEEISYSRHFRRFTHWTFVEWSFLQNASVIFYVLTLAYLVYGVLAGQKDIAALVLIMGYVSQTQTHLNAFSQITDSFTDMHVGLRHLAKNKAITTLDLDDLI